jgi:hypothetical protein
MCQADVGPAVRSKNTIDHAMKGEIHYRFGTCTTAKRTDLQDRSKGSGRQEM